MSSPSPPPSVYYVGYAEQLLYKGHGTAQWNPAPNDRVTIGDVGFMRNGRFWLLFRATCLPDELDEYQVPEGFSTLRLSLSNIDSLTQPAREIVSESVKIRKINVGGSLGTPTGLAPGASLHLELTRSEGAGFLTRFPVHCTDTLQEGTLKTYIKKHHASWVDYARDQGFGEVDPILVSGIDSARDWAMFTYSTRGHHVSTQITLDVPAVASTWAGFATTSMACSGMETNWGPEPEEPERLLEDSPTLDEPSERTNHHIYPSSVISRHTAHHHRGDRITFIRGWRMKNRPYWFPSVIKAGAEPPELDGDYDSDSDTDTNFTSDFSDETDLFGPLFKYIFENSDAETAILHDDHLTFLSQLDTNQASIETLLRQHPPIIEVEDGVATFARTSVQGEPQISEQAHVNTVRNSGGTHPEESPFSRLAKETPLEPTILDIDPSVDTYFPSPQYLSRDFNTFLNQSATESTSIASLNALSQLELLDEIEARGSMAPWYHTGLLRPMRARLLEDYPTPPEISQATEKTRLPRTQDYLQQVRSQPLAETLGQHSLFDAERNQIEEIASLVISGEALKLQGEPAAKFIDKLDRALDLSNLTNDERRMFLSTLRKLCGRCSLLPSSHQIAGTSELIECKRISSGGFADVYRGTFNVPVVAIKTIEKSDLDLSRSEKKFHRKHMLWKRMSHRNLLPFFGDGPPVIVSEWMERGSINQFLGVESVTDRLKSLLEVTRGHDIRIIYGKFNDVHIPDPDPPKQLAGAKSLIHFNRKALYADFGLRSIVLDSGTPTASMERDSEIVSILFAMQSYVGFPHQFRTREPQWKLGPDGIAIQDLFLVSVQQLSNGSWQPVHALAAEPHTGKIESDSPELPSSPTADPSFDLPQGRPAIAGAGDPSPASQGPPTLSSGPQ